MSPIMKMVSFSNRPWSDWLSLEASYPSYDNHNSRQGMVAPRCWTAMQGVDREQGVGLPNLEKATKTWETRDAVN